MAYLSVENLEKAFGGTRVLRDVSFQLPEGETLSVIGSSGSGKTTLLRCLNFLERPDGGVISLRGEPLLDASRPPDRERDLRRKRLHFGLVFQDFNLFPQYTALENVTLARRLARRDGETEQDIRDRGLDLLDQMGLSDRAGHYPHQLSGGQKQRVAIARALATRPKYLLCDEATSALDPNTTQSILHLLKEINQTLGVTIVVITHEMRVIEQICKRVAVIDQSCIAEIGNVSDVFTHPKSDIAKALILPKSPAENLPPCTGKRLRLVFDGSCSNEPVISRITLECHVPVNILFADTRIVEGSIYGHMVIDLPDDPQQFHDVLRWLDHNHISYLQED